MNLSIAQNIRKSGKPFVFYHTHEVTRDLLELAISTEKSMDLDICVDRFGTPFLGHSDEYYEKHTEVRAQSMPLWEAVELLSTSFIPVMVDCKHFEAWKFVETTIGKISPSKCLVHAFVAEFNFLNSNKAPDVSCEWIPLKQLKELKAMFPFLTTTASAKGLPHDLFENKQHKELLQFIKSSLKENLIDTVCLNIPDELFSDGVLKFFLDDGIIPHVMIDNIDTRKFSEIYIGETDYLTLASSFA